MVFYCIISVLVWGATLFSVLRMCNNSGLALPDGRIRAFICAKDNMYLGERVSTKKCKKVALYAFLYRIFIYAAAIPIIYMYIYNRTGFSLDDYLATWQKWDATCYIRIAENGYSYTEEGENLMLVFFPLYSFAVGILRYILTDTRIAALLVSTLCYSVACGYIYALVSEDYNKSIARASVVLLSVSPFSFFFGSMMTESTFLMTTAMTFYYIRRHNWKLVAIVGTLAALSRMIGVIMILPAAVEWCETYKPFGLIKEKKWKELGDVIVHSGLYIAAIALGTFVYLMINFYVTGNAFIFMQYQREHWYHENCYFAKTVVDILKNALFGVNYEHLRISIWIPSAVIIVGYIILLVYSVRRHKNMYILYMTAYLVINTSVTWLISAPRYMSAALPAFIVLAEMTEKIKAVRYVLYALFIVGMFAYLTLYLMGKNIM